MLHRRLGARVRGVKPGERRQQRSQDGDDLAAFIHPLPRFLDEEICRLGVDGEHLIVLLLGRLDERLLEHFADCIDCNVEPAVTLDRLIEQFDDV